MAGPTVKQGSGEKQRLPICRPALGPGRDGFLIFCQPRLLQPSRENTGAYLIQDGTRHPEDPAQCLTQGGPQKKVVIVTDNSR